ncbi:MAG: 6-carboxytetrahydropterin synthase [Prevotellaceae bacterium]|jgi:6-pyruvoyltetrahydropterin/6-carboxytetrahydropterin synthase|nr:6-carboxytetrahydropterin synthase [Prevotellaceae bacterium]
MQIRVTKEFSFEMSHQLDGYNGKCRNIHGHSYRLFVTVIGEPIADVNHPKCGMVVDFTDLKKLVADCIIEPLDHTLLLRTGSATAQALQHTGTKIAMVGYQPTCENMVAHFAQTLQPLLPKNVRLHSIRLYETATSHATWVANDNK